MAQKGKYSIYNSAYDDVERKTREMVEPAEAKRKLVPDEERKSLSQLYEQEFLQVNQTVWSKRCKSSNTFYVHLSCYVMYNLYVTILLSFEHYVCCRITRILMKIQ